MCEINKIKTTFDDERFRAAFAHNYHLDPDKDLDLMKELHEFGSVENVYRAKRDSFETMNEYALKLKNFVLSDCYKRMDEISRKRFESKAFEVLKGITIKAIGTEHIMIQPLHYLSNPDVNSFQD